MNTAIEMHDSEVDSVEIASSGDGSVLLEAYVHRTEGEPGRAVGDGGVQLIRLTISDIKVEGAIGELPTYIYEGSLSVGKEVQDNIVTFPAKHHGIIRLYMMLAPDARIITVTGTSVTITSESEFCFVETFSPRSHLGRA